MGLHRRGLGHVYGSGQAPFTGQRAGHVYGSGRTREWVGGGGVSPVVLDLFSGPGNGAEVAKGGVYKWFPTLQEIRGHLLIIITRLSFGFLPQYWKKDYSKDYQHES